MSEMLIPYMGILPVKWKTIVATQRHNCLLNWSRMSRVRPVPETSTALSTGRIEGVLDEID